MELYFLLIIIQILAVLPLTYLICLIFLKTPEVFITKLIISSLLGLILGHAFSLGFNKWYNCQYHLDFDEPIDLALIIPILSSIGFAIIKTIHLHKYRRNEKI